MAYSTPAGSTTARILILVSSELTSTALLGHTPQHRPGLLFMPADSCDRDKDAVRGDRSRCREPAE